VGAWIPKPSWRALLASVHDAAAAAAAWYLAFLLRFNLEFHDPYLSNMLQTLPWVVAAQAPVFWFFGLYRGIWRYASLPDLKRIVLAVTTAALVVPMLLKMINMLGLVPRSALLLDPILLLLMMGGSRLGFRVWKEVLVKSVIGSSGQPVIVIGGGDAALRLLRELSQSREWQVVGVLDDNPRKHGRLMHGIKVVGALDRLRELAESTEVRHAIIAMPGASKQVRRRALELCAQSGVKALTVPSLNDLMQGNVQISQVRQVELDDLLGRDPVVLDNAGLQSLLTGSVVLVTGAGGSIGSELCRQIARFEPKQLVLVDNNEFALYRIEQEFGERFRDLAAEYVIGDCRNAHRVRQLLAQHRPAIVFHAAAYKHVPMMEGENAWEAVQNNGVGAWNMARLAIEHGVNKFVLVSTDKAVNPVNVMGASKRLAEMICQQLQTQSTTHFITVRFGNVLGSSGSVIPKFREQIARGGPITVTHPDITRYFMSIPEAAQLVLQAALMGQGGEIFVLDMGSPVRIVDLARDMIRLSGMTEDEIGIVFTGLRPGEKLYEELLADDENTIPTRHPKLRIARARSVQAEWLPQVENWFLRNAMLSEDEVKAGLRRWVPDYLPNMESRTAVGHWRKIVGVA
jgi:FlaA1/EpsC-like NDP-sugar epimerase